MRGMRRYITSFLEACTPIGASRRCELMTSRRRRIIVERRAGIFISAVVYSPRVPMRRFVDSFSGSAITEFPSAVFGNRDMARGVQVCHDYLIIGNGGKTGDHLLSNE